MYHCEWKRETWIPIDDSPGVYSCPARHMHIDIGQILIAHGFRATPENIEKVARAAVEVAERNQIRMTVVE